MNLAFDLCLEINQVEDKLIQQVGQFGLINSI